MEPASQLSCMQASKETKLGHLHSLLCVWGQRPALSPKVLHCKPSPEGWPPRVQSGQDLAFGAHPRSTRADGRLPLPVLWLWPSAAIHVAQTPSGCTLGSESILPGCEFQFHHLTSSKLLAPLCLSFSINNKATWQDSMLRHTSCLAQSLTHSRCCVCFRLCYFVTFQLPFG